MVIFASHNFPKCFGEEKQTFIGPTTIPVLQFYVKELLWNEKSREHRREKSFGVSSASGEHSVLRRTNGGVTLWLPAGHEDAAEYLIRIYILIRSTPGGGEIRL